MIKLKTFVGCKTRLVAVGALMLGAALSSLACTSDDDGASGDGDGDGDGNTGGEGGKSGDGDGDDESEPDPMDGDVQYVPCSDDVEGLKKQVYAASEWTDDGACTAAFISKWDTAQPGVSDEKSIQLPLVEVGAYDFWVNWGDDKVNHITAYDASELTHSYAKSGEYEVRIIGEIEGWRFAEGDPDLWSEEPHWKDAEKLLDISQWGPFALGATDAHFFHAKNLTGTATDVPDLSKTTSLAYSFAHCESFVGVLNGWDTSTVTSLLATFYDARKFNSDISSWNVSNVTTLARMFTKATSFNQPIGAWDVSSVTILFATFFDASSFNQPLNNWDVSNVTSLGTTFENAVAFDQELSAWDVSKVTQLQQTFRGALNFNRDISAWNTVTVNDLSGAFAHAKSFNQDIGAWDTSSVSRMFHTFEGATSFNQDLSTWDTSKVQNMESMFEGATDFNQDLSGWDVSKVQVMDNMLDLSGLSTDNYSLLLKEWSKLPLWPNVTLGAESLTYSVLVEAERQSLIDVYSWTIIDAGQY